MAIEHVEVSLGKESGTMVFESLDELSAWLTKEQQYWSWLQQPPYTNEKNSVWQTFWDFRSSVSNQINEAIQFKNASVQKGIDPNLVPYLATIRNQFQNYYVNSRGIASTSPAAKFVENLKATLGLNIAGVACGFLMGLPFNYSNYDGVTGAIEASLFTMGLKDAGLSEKQALDELHATWQATFQRFKETLQTETEKQSAINSNAATFLEGQKDEFAKLLEAQKRDVESALKMQGKALQELASKTATDFSNLKKAYDSELAVKAPVLYWRQKTSAHLRLSWTFGVVTALVATGIGIGLFYGYQWLIEPPKGVNVSDNWHPQYWKIAAGIAFGLLGVWIVRIFVRLFLIHVDLHTDAKERVTLVQTYLALRRKGQISAKDESLILKVLFRPSAKSLTKDDAVPLTILEALTKR